MPAPVAGSERLRGRVGLLAPAAVMVVAGLVLATLAFRDPHVDGRYPTCPVLELTGCYCPGCGSMRGLHALATGDLAGVVAHNALLPVGVVLLAWAWVSWTGRRSAWWRVRAIPASAKACYVGVGVVVAFGVLRNIPVEPFVALAPYRSVSARTEPRNRSLRIAWCDV